MTHNTASYLIDTIQERPLEAADFLEHLTYSDGVWRFHGRQVTVKVLETPVGRGGYGTVFSAFFSISPSEKVPFALKVEHSGVRGNDAYFCKHIQTAHLLSNEAIIPQFYVGTVKGKLDTRERAMYAMPLMLGDLGDLIPMEHHQANWCVQRIRSILDILLCHNWRYADVKPQNVLYFYTPEGELKVYLGDMGSGDRTSTVAATAEPPFNIQKSRGFTEATRQTLDFVCLALFINLVLPVGDTWRQTFHNFQFFTIPKEDTLLILPEFKLFLCLLRVKYPSLNPLYECIADELLTYPIWG